MLEELKENYQRCAEGLGDYTSIDKTTLANGYCDADEAGDDLKRDQYFSALILRYWYKIGRYYQDSKTTFSLEDCYDWLVHALLYALNHKPWRVKGNKLYNDPTGPDKTINRCIISARLIAYQHANTDKSRITHSCYSLDSLNENLGDSIFDGVEGLEDEKTSHTNQFIRMCLETHQPLKAFIIDGICNQGVFKETETKEKVNGKSYIDYDEDGNEVTVKEDDYSYKKVTYEFSNKRLIKHLSNMDNNFLNYFASTYGINKEIVESEAQKLANVTSTKLNKMVMNTMLELKDDKEFKEMLCL